MNVEDINGVSVVIVTYNGINRIKPTLEFLSKQLNVNFPWELIIVDNNSNDGTAEYSREIWKELGQIANLRIIYENNPGTMNARSCGIRNSKYRYILFCDDDNWLKPNYLSEAYIGISSNSKIAVLGGCGFPVYEDDRNVPYWINDYIDLFGCGSQGSKDGDVTKERGCLYSAGSIFDKNWLVDLHNYKFISILPGRKANSLIAGEDTELTYALVLIGGKLHFNSNMEFFHYMPKNRMTDDYLKRLNYSIGFANYILTPYTVDKLNTAIFDFLITFLLCVKYKMKFIFSENSVIKFRNMIFFLRFKGQLYSIFKHSNHRRAILLWKSTL